MAYDTTFRDAAAADKYPFDPQATQTVFPTQLFIDASLYVPSSFEPPFYIKSVEPAVGSKVRVVIVDSRGSVAGTAICNYTDSTGTAIIYTDYGRSAGVLVFSPEYMERLRGDLHAGPRSFNITQTKLASEVVRYYGPKGVLNIVTDKVSVHENVRIVFAGGITYGADGSINLYGEEASQERQLLTINGRYGEHVLLMAHVFKDYETESALRLETFGSYIMVGKSRDFV